MIINRNQTQARLEHLNSSLHALGILFGIIFLPVLIIHAVKTGYTPGIIGAVIYSCCFLMVFIFSTLYHRCTQPGRKAVLQTLDHISIYFLIAGTYTPLVLIFVNNTFGVTILTILWSLTSLGILFKIFFTGRFEIVSTVIYVVMGWMLFAGGSTFFKSMPAPVVALVIAGGLLYSIGVVFYLWQRYLYHHAVWHVFVLTAAICHYAAVLMSV